MRVAIRKSDGKILEAQSNDDAPMDALRDNVINVRGYTEDDVEFTLLDEDEVKRRIEAQNEARQDYATKRRKLYEKRGATMDALVIAMFEKDAAEIERLGNIRQQVKLEIPKNDRNR